MSLIRKAKKIIAKEFEGVIGKDGKPYHIHCTAVARLSGLTEDYAYAAALLHDVVEDTDYTLEMLAEEFPFGTIQIVDLLTRRKNEDYTAFIDRLYYSDNKVAIKIKIADLVHNLDYSRFDGEIPSGIINRGHYYLDALNRLQKKYLKLCRT